ncbi:TFIIF beta subunit HTH domain-containing protein [Entamoeba marina]
MTTEFSDLKPKLKPLVPSERRNQFYLLKLDEMLYKHFTKEGGSGDSVLMDDKGTIDSLQIETIVDDLKQTKKYSLIGKPLTKKLYFIKQLTKEFSLHGSTDKYFQTIVCRDETIKQTKPKKPLVTDEEEEEEIGHRPAPSKDKRDKRVRMETYELKRKLFELFAAKKEMTFQELNKIVDQPESFLRSVLKDCCDEVQVQSGPKTYQLKPQYQNN